MLQLSGQIVRYDELRYLVHLPPSSIHIFMLTIRVAFGFRMQQSGYGFSTQMLQASFCCCLLRPSLSTHHNTFSSHCLCGGRTVLLGIAVGMTATCFNAPFDVVKSRFQSQLPDNRKYKTTVGALAIIYREEGPQVSSP